jgi:hypothetical protein
MNRKLKLLAAVFGSFAVLAAVALAASSPSVSTGSPTSVTSKSAELRGSVNPNGAKTGYQFQWGLSNTYGTNSRLRSAGRGTKTIPVKLGVNGLLPGTPYHFRLIAFNRVGEVFGSDRTFKTKGNPPPYAATGPTTQVSTSSATVTGVINPNGQKTSWYFQYGLSSSYSSQTVMQTVPAGTSPVPVSQQISGLASGMIFHYRIVAVNRGVTEYGNDAAFMTFPNPRPVPRVHARTRPRHARSRPYVFTTSGRVIGPSSIPSTYGCSQTVKIRFMLGKRRVALKLAPVQPDCTFSAQTVFKHRPGRGHRGAKVHLRVLIRFLGNGYLAPRSARTERVTLG